MYEFSLLKLAGTHRPTNFRCRHIYTTVLINGGTDILFGIWEYVYRKIVPADQFSMTKLTP